MPKNDFPPTQSAFPVSIAYLSPLVNTVNQFTRFQVEDLQALGLQVASLNRGLFHDWHIQRRRKILVLNWFEDRVGASSRPWFELLRCLLTLALLRLRIGTIVWVRHNETAHAEHGTTRVSGILRKAMTLFADLTATLRPSDLAPHVLPHPAYVTAKTVVEPGAARRDAFVLFGSVRPNKGYDQLLGWWPPDRQLTILGRCSDPDHAATLRAIIADRQLDVDWQDRFVPDDELNRIVSRHRYVIVVHRDGTSLVSGTFFHAASLGANVLVTPGAFERYVCAAYTFALPLTEAALRTPHTYVAPQTVVAELVAANGSPARRAAWAALLRGLGRALPVPPTPANQASVDSCTLR